MLHLSCLSVGLKLACLSSLVLSPKHAIWELAKKVLQDADVLSAVLGLRDRALEILDFALGGLVTKLSHDRVQEVYSSKRSRDDWEDWMSRSSELDLRLSPNMRENVTLAQLYQCKLGVVGMCGVVLKTMTACSKEPECFEEIFLPLASRVLSAKLDTPSEQISDKACGSCDAGTLGGNVGLEA